MVRVFVYSGSVVPCNNSRTDKDLFETKLQDVLSTSRWAAAPHEADIFYHPACLVDFYFSVRARPDARALLFDAERAVLTQISEGGHSDKPHIVNSLRCFTNKYWDEHSPIIAAYPILWRSGRFARFCTESPHTVDTRRAVHVPYCPSGPWTLPAPKFRPTRSTRVLFIGSDLRVRNRMLRLLHQQNISRKLVIVNPFRRTTPSTLWCDVSHPLHTYCPERNRSLSLKHGRRTMNVGVSSADVLALMEDATYTFCPAGDTPDSPRLYSAIAHGSVPLLDPTTQLVPLFNWSTVSALIRFDSNGSMIFPSARNELALLRAVWTFRNSIDCEQNNPLLNTYLDRALAHLVTSQLAVTVKRAQLQRELAARRAARSAARRAKQQHLLQKRANASKRFRLAVLSSRTLG